MKPEAATSSPGHRDADLEDTKKESFSMAKTSWSIDPLQIRQFPIEVTEFGGPLL